MDDPVRAQYERYPYPARDPRDERKRLIEGYPSHLVEVNHYVFAGARDFTRPFRALVAGGGTGDGAIMLAQHLADRGCPAEVVYLDISAASRRIAEARAAERGLANLRFLQADLMELPRLGLGRFDYIDCCGVLHHLEDPAAGLRVLAGALAEEGGLGLMLYGAIGRSGVYDVQEALRRLAPPGLGAESRLEIARRLLRQLPPTNRLRRNPVVVDHLRGGDAALFDLLLHGRDRAYTVPQVHALLGGAGLAAVAFVEPWRYDPASYLNDAALLRRVQALPEKERQALAELIAGNMKVHVCYAVPAARAGHAVARADSPAVRPRPWRGDGAAIAQALKPGPSITARIDGLAVSFPLPRRAAPILRLIDGRRSLAEIHATLAASTPGGLGWDDFKADFDRLYAVLNGINLLFLERLPLPPGH
ncbi:MAG: class I SAM-dependent methyltransferase [Rhodospirillaceae bacterium]|nr:class I SAM-dependent methyltransferase [Rhodospirillaceae bacterium]